MRSGLIACVAFLLIACDTLTPPEVDPTSDERFVYPASCDTLFGRPTLKTGVSEERCMPRCENCGELVFTSPLYTDEEIAELRRWRIREPFEPLDEDPYANPSEYPLRSDKFCGVLPEPGVASDAYYYYTLVNYDSVAEALAAGAQITHSGACGRCSTLHNLAAYIEYPDLTDPVRECGLTGFGDYSLSQLACIASVGFDLPCAQIWSFNTNHTRDVCGTVCLSELSSTHNEPDGRLNPCLYCDEVRSGDIFKAVAGRTRRNSGLASEVCRPCFENGEPVVYPAVHRYTPPPVVSFDAGTFVSSEDAGVALDAGDAAVEGGL